MRTKFFLRLGTSSLGVLWLLIWLAPVALVGAAWPPWTCALAVADGVLGCLALIALGFALGPDHRMG